MGPQHVEGIDNAEDALALVQGVDYGDEYDDPGFGRPRPGRVHYNRDRQVGGQPQNGLAGYDYDAYGERNEADPMWDAERNVADPRWDAAMRNFLPPAVPVPGPRPHLAEGELNAMFEAHTLGEAPGQQRLAQPGAEAQPPGRPQLGRRARVQDYHLEGTAIDELDRPEDRPENTLQRYMADFRALLPNTALPTIPTENHYPGLPDLPRAPPGQYAEADVDAVLERVRAQRAPGAHPPGYYDDPGRPVGVLDQQEAAQRMERHFSRAHATEPLGHGYFGRPVAQTEQELRERVERNHDRE